MQPTFMENFFGVPPDMLSAILLPILITSSYGQSASKGYEYEVYLPLYNDVKWLEVGVQEGYKLEFLPASQEKPIVLYGTSIAQGACASRPGMAFGNVIGRNWDIL